ncbi:MAG: hypothetical protein Q4G52_01530 [Clostridia bacterium]|nr:hypothetical protein [Clostridia bacterium]
MNSQPKRAGKGASPAAGTSGSPPPSRRRRAGRWPALGAREGAFFMGRQPEWYRESRLFVPGRQAFLFWLKYILPETEGEKTDYEEDDFRRAAQHVAEFL